MGPMSFAPASVVGVDSQILIYTVERVPQYWPVLMSFLDQVQSGLFSVYMSELAVLECLVRPLRSADLEIVDAFEMFFKRPRITLAPVSVSVLREAAQLRSTTKSLRTPDAIQIATARLRNVDHFLTNDHALRRIQGLHVTILDDYCTTPNS